MLMFRMCCIHQRFYLLHFLRHCFAETRELFPTHRKFHLQQLQLPTCPLLIVIPSLSS